MCLCDAVVAHLGQHLTYVLISGFRILHCEFGKVRHTKPPQIWYGVKHFWVRLLVSPSSALRL
jgi:hypothetical protein